MNDLYQKYRSAGWLEEHGKIKDTNDTWISFTHPDGNWCHYFSMDSCGNAKANVQFDPNQRITLRPMKDS